MQSDEGLVCAHDLAASGDACELDWDGVRGNKDGVLWVHLDRAEPTAQRWLREESGIDPLICEALLVDETRPRVSRERNGIMVILRGVNLNPGADPEDMVSIRLWIEEHRVISLRMRRLLAVADVREIIMRGEGPSTAPELAVLLIRQLTGRIGPVVDDLEEALDELEDGLINAPEKTSRAALSGLRRQAVALRRYLAPQRDALARLVAESWPGFSERDRAQLREQYDRTTRFVEDLDAARERAAVTHEELFSRMQDRMNRNMYVLSLVAAVFLPLGFLTGLLGINVGGMPGADSPTAFWIVCGLLTSLGLIELAMFYYRRWL